MINLPPIRPNNHPKTTVKRSSRYVAEADAATRAKKQLVERRFRQDRRKNRQKALLMERRLLNDRRRSVIDLSV